MATLTCDVRNESPRGFILFLLVILLVVSGVIVYGYASDHANGKHGTVAELVDNACSRGGEVTLLNPITRRIAMICIVEKDGRKVFGIGIYEHGRNVTAFLKEKMTRLDQVVSYLKNQGYTVK